MPRYGFNFQWMFSYNGTPPAAADERALDFMAATGFDFVRIPCDYNFWTTDFNYFQPDESVFTHIDRYLAACQARGFHMSLNLHRAPGYCINRNDREKHNLWVDAIAQDAFVFTWETFARRYHGVSSRDLSFDLVNEPATCRVEKPRPRDDLGSFSVVIELVNERMAAARSSTRYLIEE